MTIAIIGSGAIGRGLARVLSRTSEEVILADREGGTAATASLAGAGVTVQPAHIADAIARADLVILATPFAASKAIAGSHAFAGKVLVDLSNPVTEDVSALQLGHSTSAAEEIAAAAGVPVVKAFNTVFAQHYAGDLTVGGRPLQTFVASDDAEAKARVIALASSVGFDARDAGGLRAARHLEPLGYLNISFGYMLGQGTAIAPAWLSA